MAAVLLVLVLLGVTLDSKDHATQTNTHVSSEQQKVEIDKTVANPAENIPAS